MGVELLVVVSLYSWIHPWNVNRFVEASGFCVNISAKFEDESKMTAIGQAKMEQQRLNCGRETGSGFRKYGQTFKPTERPVDAWG